MLRSGRKVPETGEIIKIIAEGQEKWQQKLKGVLPALTFEQRWDIIKKTRPNLDKNKTRDLMRLFLADSFAAVKAKLDEAEERFFAVECLEYFPSRETVDLLVELLEHKDEHVRLCAAGALKSHTPRLVVPALVKAMLFDRVLPARAGEVLLTMGYLAQDTLLETYPLAVPQVKAQILELLTQGENPKCRALLSDALASKNKLLRSKALDAVGFFRFDDFWLEAAECLLDSDWPIRAKALEVLGKLGVQKSRVYVELLLCDADQWVRECAVRCLAELDKLDKQDNRDNRGNRDDGQEDASNRIDMNEG